MNSWGIVYERAIRADGSLFFPERLTKEFLLKARETMGSYFFANQYQNEIIPDEEKRFKSGWLKYYTLLPNLFNTFAFIDPAIGQKSHHDYTGLVVIKTDVNGHWYLEVAKRERLTPTQIVDLIFDVHKQFKCLAIGLETVAYQEALLYILDEKCKQTKTVLPIKSIKRANISKETRILGLVPRFEWGRISIARGLTDFEDEYCSFPRGTYDDILDSLASCEEIVTYPIKKEPKLEKPNSPSDPKYESWYIRQLVDRANYGASEES